jgi:ABC-type molybdate transport system substrate-binding protein
VRYLVHVGTGSPQAALAREFVAYLGSDAARAVWLRSIRFYTSAGG